MQMYHDDRWVLLLILTLIMIPACAREDQVDLLQARYLEPTKLAVSTDACLLHGYRGEVEYTSTEVVLSVRARAAREDCQSVVDIVLDGQIDNRRLVDAFDEQRIPTSGDPDK